jgi:type VI secretion system protein ImpL
MEEGTPSVAGAGRTFSVTWAMPSLDTEVIIDFRPTRSASPFFGVSPGRTPKMMQPFRAPGMSPPRVIAKGGVGCSG